MLNGHALINGTPRATARSDRVLVIATDNPFPPDSGGRVRTRGVLEMLAQSFALDVLTYARPANPDLDEARCRLTIVEVPQTVTPRSAALRSLYTLRSAGYMSHADIDLREPLESLCRTRTYRFVVVANSMMGHLIPTIRRLQPDVRLVLLSENVETNLWCQLARAETRPIRKVFFALSAFHTMRNERRACRDSDLVLATSDEEAVDLGALSPRDRSKIVVIPNFIRAERYRIYRDRDVGARSIILPGDMSYFPNVAGARYFYTQIYGRLRREFPDLRWVVAGRNCHPSIRDLVKDDPSVVITGAVPDVAEYIARSTAVIVPLLHGSGTRVKILEAWAIGRPVVSTSKGCEGMRCRHDHDILIGDTPETFIAGVARLLRDRDYAARLAHNAMETLRSYYDAPAIEPRLRAALSV